MARRHHAGSGRHPSMKTPVTHAVTTAAQRRTSNTEKRSSYRQSKR